MNESAEEIRARLIERMGPPLGEVFYLLRNYLVDLQITWIEFTTLFATDQSTVDLLNSVAPSFFARLQTVYWHDVLMGLCRLTDPTEAMGRPNLSVMQLPSLVADPNLRSRVGYAVAEARQTTKFARDWRNRRLAHLDLKRAKDPAANSLQPASRQSVEKALASLGDVMNSIEEAFLDSKTGYQHTITALGDAQSLLFWLRRAKK